MTDWPAAASPSLPQGPPHGFAAPAQQRNDANPITPFTSEQVAALRAKFLETLLQTVVLAVTNTLTSIPAFDQLQSWAEGVNVIVDTTVQALIDGIANALGHTGAEPYSAADIFTFLQEIPGSVISGITTIEQNIIDAIAQAMGHAGTGHTAANILTYLQAIPSTVVTNVLGAADLGADIQAVVDKISNALGHAGTGHTLANLLSYLGAIPGSVISGITTIEQAALDAIANALGHAGTGHTTSDIQTYLGAIPGSVISGITTIEQNALDAIANALGHAGTGHTTSDIQTYLAAIPGSVISGITTIEQNALDAIANALGHAGTGHTTSDIQTYLGAIPATVVTNILGSANLGADLQALVTNLTAVFGGVTTTLTGLNTTLGNTFGSTFPKVFPFTFGTSSSNTPGKFATLAQFQQLLDGIIGDGSQGNTVVAAIGAFHNWLAAVKAEISQAILDGLNTVAGIGTAIETALTQISHVNITSIFGNSHLGTDIQNFLDGVINAITGGSGSGNSTAAIPTALGYIPHGNVVIPANPGSGSIALDATSNGTPAARGNMSPWSHTVGASGNYLIVNVAALTANSSSTAAVTYGGVPMSLLKSVTSGSLIYSLSQIWGLANPAVGTADISVTVTVPATVPSVVQASAQSYTNVASVGSANGASGSNSNPSNAIPSATGDLVVNTLMVASGTTETLSSYSQTSRYNPGSTQDVSPGTGFYMAMLAGDASGSANVTFSATASYTTSNEWAYVAVNLVPIPATILGSGFRQYRNSASSATMISGSGDSLLPNSFFDTNDKLTSDITSAPATANKITLSYDGWYIVTICLYYSGWNAGAFYSCPILYKNGSVAQRGNYDNNGLGSGAAFTGPRQSTFIVYCSANDTLQPGIMSNGAFSGIGESTGTYCYWEVALANRGVLS